MTSEILSSPTSQPTSRTNPDYKSLVSKLTEPLVVFNAHGKPCFTNPAARALLTGSLAGRLTSHLQNEFSRRPIMQVRFPRDNGGTIVLKISRTHIEWDGQSAVLVSLHDVTAYINALQDSRSSFENKSQQLTTECEQLRQRLHEADEAGDALKAEIASLETRLQEAATAHAAQIAELQEANAQASAQTDEPEDVSDAMPSKENIIAAAMRKAWAVRGQATQADAWGVPVPEQPQDATH